MTGSPDFISGSQVLEEQLIRRVDRLISALHSRGLALRSHGVFAVLSLATPPNYLTAMPAQPIQQGAICEQLFNS